MLSILDIFVEHICRWIELYHNLSTCRLAPFQQLQMRPWNTFQAFLALFSVIAYLSIWYRYNIKFNGFIATCLRYYDKFLRHHALVYLTLLIMSLYAVAHAFGGACLINSIPHLTSGLAGRPFPSPFSSPRGVGLSSPVLNFLWGYGNLVLAYCLLVIIGNFSFHNLEHMIALVSGSFSCGLLLAYHFGKVFEGQ